MKKLIYFLFTAILLSSCGSKPKIITYKIKGKVPGLEGNKVILYKIDKKLKYQPIDTTVVKDSIFSFEIPKQNPDVGVVQFDGTQKKMAIIIGDGNVDMNIKDNFDFLANIDNSTSMLTKKFFNYERQSLKDKEKGMALMKKYKFATTQSERDTIKKEFTRWRNNAKKQQYDFVKNNKDIVGLVVMQSLLMSPEAEFGTIRKAYESYPQGAKQTGLGKYVNTTLLTKGATQIGGKAPIFIAPTPEGKKLSLNQAMGKVTLIDFWASWCRPCRAENPYVVQIYNKYHDRGFNVIGVSLDKNKQSWLKAIQDDGLKWQHVSNLKFWQEPVAKLYGVMSIPQTYLLDAKGIIRAKNLRREELDKKVKELLDE